MKKILMMTTLASMMLASCSKDDFTANSQDGKSPLSVVVGGINTKAIKTGTQFVTNDIIGVFIAGTGYTSAVSKYTYNGTTWSAETGKDIWLTGNAATVYGFYPATLISNTPAPTASTTFNVSVPVTDDFTATGSSDNLWAKPSVTASNSDDASTKATLVFHHSLAKISFIFVADASYPLATGTGKLTEIKLSSAGSKIVMGGTVKVDGTFTANAASGASVTYSLAAGSTINASNITVANRVVNTYAMVAPVDYTTTGDFTLKATIDGKAMTVSGFPAIPNWSDAGKNYVYTITVSPAQLKINTVTISDWAVSPDGTTITAS
jgi:hypothetical protein